MGIKPEAVNTDLTNHKTQSGHGYVYNADSGLQKWRATIAKLKTGTQQIFNVSCMGDSITEGANGTDYIANGYIGVLRSYFASLFGDVGKGFIPHFYPNNSPLWTFTGTWFSNFTFGITKFAKQTTTVGSTASLNFNGTGISIMVAFGSGGGEFTVQIDGGSATTYNTFSGSGTSQGWINVTGLSNGAHTLLITKINTGNLWLIGAMEIKGSAGIRFNNVCRYGRLIGDNIDSPNYFGLNAAIDQFNPVLTMIAYMANDSNAGTSLTQYRADMQTTITRAKSFGDVMIISTGVHTNISTSIEAQYASILKELALQNNCVYIDMFSKWVSGSNANNLGFLSDQVHPNNSGHWDIANTALKVLAP